MLLLWKNFSSEYATFHLVVADRRATARTTTFVEPCSIQTKKNWLSFMHLLATKKGSGNDMDVEIGRLLPLFSCRNYHIPCRVLTETEVTVLSGLEGHWTRTSAEDAHQLPEDLIRSMCGNSFPPDLIGSALGSNERLKQWISQPLEGTLPIVKQHTRSFQI